MPACWRAARPGGNITAVEPAQQIVYLVRRAEPGFGPTPRKRISVPRRCALGLYVQLRQDLPRASHRWFDVYRSRVQWHQFRVNRGNRQSRDQSRKKRTRAAGGRQIARCIPDVLDGFDGVGSRDERAGGNVGERHRGRIKAFALVFEERREIEAVVARDFSGQARHANVGQTSESAQHVRELRLGRAPARARGGRRGSALRSRRDSRRCPRSDGQSRRHPYARSHWHAMLVERVVPMVAMPMTIHRARDHGRARHGGGDRDRWSASPRS